MNYVLICEIPFPSRHPPGRALHTRRLTRDQVIAAIKTRWNDVEATLSLLDACSDQEGAGARHFGVPVELPSGRHTLHVEGKLDYEARRYRWPCPACQTAGKGCQHRLPLEWVDSDHVCSARCCMGVYARGGRYTHFTVR